MNKTIEKLNTEKAKNIYKYWARGLFCRQDVLSCYLEFIGEYMNHHSQEFLDIAKDLLYLLTDVIPE